MLAEYIANIELITMKTIETIFIFVREIISAGILMLVGSGMSGICTKCLLNIGLCITGG